MNGRQQREGPCNVCKRPIVDSRYRRSLGTRTSECATAALEGVICELGLSGISLPRCVCRQCFLDLENLRKAESKVALLKARFRGYLRTNVTSSSSQSPTAHPHALPDPTQSTPVRRSAMKRTAHDSPLTTATPSSRPPARKRPVVIPLSNADGTDTVGVPRRLLEFEGPHAQIHLQSQTITQAQSPIVQVEEIVMSEHKKVYRVGSSLKSLLTDVAKGNYHSFARKAMKIEVLKRPIVAAVCSEVRQECQKLCTTICGKTSVLRDTSPTHLKQFSWKELCHELEDRSAIFFEVLQAAVKRQRKQHSQKSTQQSIGFAASILLHERNQFMCAPQCINSVILHTGHASKMIFTRLRTIGVCLSHRGSLNLLDRLGVDHDGNLRVWQSHLTSIVDGSTQSVTVSVPTDGQQLQQLSKAVLDLSLQESDGRLDGMEISSDSETECQSKKREIASEEHQDAAMEANSGVTTECFGYKLVGDNIDKKIKPRHMRVDKQSRMLNYFHSYAVKSRVAPAQCMQSDESPSIGQFLCLELEDILPTEADKAQLLSNYCIIFCRVLCKYAKYFKAFSTSVPQHILHSFSTEMSKESEVVPLGVLFKSEQKNDDMMDIVKALHHYVPMVEHIQEEVVDVDGVHEPVKIVQQQMHKILFGGDQLTVERARGIQRVRDNSDSASQRADGLVPVCEDWHAKMCIYKVLWGMLYKCNSSQDGGTLFQLRNLINRRNVIKDVRNDMNATEDFFETVLTGHILTVTMEYFSMENLDSTPTHPSLTRELTKDTDTSKWKILSGCIKELLEKYVAVSLHCYNCDESIPEVSDDGVYEYACTILSMGLLILEFDDGVREGDGDRVCRVWKYLTLLFSKEGRTKYALEALNLQFQLNGLPPRQAFEVKWSRFVNSKGGMGKNVSCDLHMEHLNRACKTAVLGLGANVSEKSIDRVSKCLKMTLEVCDNFDCTNSVPVQSDSHTAASAEKDIELIVQELQKSEVFTEIEGRSHYSFHSVLTSQCISSPHQLKELEDWFKQHREKFINANIPYNDSDIGLYMQ